MRKRMGKRLKLEKKDIEPLLPSIPHTPPPLVPEAEPVSDIPITNPQLPLPTFPPDIPQAGTDKGGGWLQVRTTPAEKKQWKKAVKASGEANLSHWARRRLSAAAKFDLAKSKEKKTK